MQEEIIKHSRKIRRAGQNKQHSTLEKVKEISIEIFIIVFAVTLSIWLHSWSEHRHEQEDVNKFLKELRENLTADIKVLDDNKKGAQALQKDYNFVINLKESEVKNGLIYNHLNLILLNKNFNVGTYEGFKSSGKIGTIEQEQLKYKILNYYQQSLPNLNNTVDYINTEELKMMDVDLATKGIFNTLTNSTIQQKFKNLNYNVKGIITNYDEVIKEAKEIIAESEEADR